MTSAASLLLGTFLLAAPTAPPPDEVRNRLDEVVAAKWKSLDLLPTAQTDDAAFLRRVYLDLTGRVPPPLKARDFLDDRDPAKRVRLVETLLASEEFADHWGRSWAMAFTGRRPIKQEKYDGRLLQDYLKQALAANKPYKQIVTDLICAEGVSDASGPVNFLLRYEVKPTDLAGAVSKNFLGVTLQCAQCHDHPFARWKKGDFWGMAAFFGSIRLYESNDDNQYPTAVLETRKGELMVPDLAAPPSEKGELPRKVVQPRFPEAKSAVARERRRQALAAWLTADANPYFARNLVNRVWTQLFGIGLANGFDQQVQDRDGKHPEVLALLAKDFVASGQDVKRLVRVIVLSRAYQLSAAELQAEADTEQAVELRRKKQRNWACFPTRPLSADQLYQSIVQATGHRGQEPDPKEPAAEDAGSPDPPVELLGESALTVQRSLVLLNGDYVHQAAQSGAKTAMTVVGRAAPADQVEWLFLAVLSRRPTTAEAEAMLALLKKGKGVSGLEDVLWVLLNSVEFNTNH